MRVIVLGAGVVGVTTAWYLAADGHEVTVIERQPDPALETSFANGGQISVSHAEPWASPSAPLRLLRSLGRDDAPLLWHLRADPALMAWGLKFLAQCRPARMRANIQAIVGLGLSSREALQALREQLGLRYDHLQRGILHFYTDADEYRRALPNAALMREYGCDRQPGSTAECLRIEPALAHSSLPIVGGTYTASDESGDAHVFTAALAKLAQDRYGVSFRYATEARSLFRPDRDIRGVRLASGEIVASDATVVALGSYSRAMLEPQGVSLPVYPAKGYSVTIPLDAAGAMQAPEVSLTDDGCKLVFSRLRNRLRVAGTAEFCGYDTSINALRCDAIVRRVRQIFPGLPVGEAPDYWAGLRPATPGNVPYIGSLAHHGLSGLWLNTGHGTLGWTLSCGSARLLADVMAGRRSKVPDPAAYRF